MANLALLVLRLTLGGLLAGHGAQKLFGWFGGHGLQGTSAFMESLDLRPPKLWTMAAGVSEFGGGILMLLGFLNPLGPLGAIGSMGMAIAKVHPLNKPIWVTSGGAELPLTNIAIAIALGLAAPGRYSLDGLLGRKVPRWMLLPGIAVAGLGVALGLRGSEQPQEIEDQAGGELQAGQEAAHPV